MHDEMTPIILTRYAFGVYSGASCAKCACFHANGLSVHSVADKSPAVSAMDVNVSALIKEVAKREVLWDLSHKEHNNRFLLEKLWMEVAANVGVNVREVRQKWKYLRDQHRREVRKIADSAAEGIMIYEPSWKYFQSLCFLDGQITQKGEKSSVGTFVPEQVEVSNILAKSDFWEEEPSVVFEDTMHSAASSTHVQQEVEERSRKRKRSKMDIDEDLLVYLVKLERKKVELLLAQDDAKKMENSDDFYFMSSLLPVLKTFSNIQKLRIRNRILQVIIDEMNGDNVSDSPQPSDN